MLALPIGAEVGAIDIMSNRSYNSGMPARRGNSFEDFYGELEADARAEGPEAIRDLRAKEIKYALINTLITRRRDLNLTQQTLAEHAGVAQTEISKIERGRKSPTLDTFSRIAGALRLTFSAAGNAPRTVLGARRINAGAALAWRVEEKDSATLPGSKVAPRRRIPAAAMATSRRTARTASHASAKKETSASTRRRKKRTMAE